MFMQILMHKLEYCMDGQNETFNSVVYVEKQRWKSGFPFKSFKNKDYE